MSAPGTIRDFAKYPGAALIFSLIFGVICLCLGISSWLHLQSLPEKPEPMALSEVGRELEIRSNIWVALSGVEWDCNNLIVKPGMNHGTEIIFTDEQRTVLGVAEFSKELTCEEILQAEPTGEVNMMSETYLDRLPRRGFDLSAYTTATAQINLCTFCGRPNSTLGVWIGGGGIIAVIYIYLSSLYANRKYRLTGRLPYDRY